jgi:hypothetical protein
VRVRCDTQCVERGVGIWAGGRWGGAKPQYGTILQRMCEPERLIMFRCAWGERQKGNGGGGKGRGGVGSAGKGGGVLRPSRSMAPSSGAHVRA